jgi:hypothetical protein
MARKTKIRVVGDPDLASQVIMILSDFCEFEKAPQRLQRAVGRDYSHSQASGATIYATLKKLTLAGKIHLETQLGNLQSALELKKEASAEK